MVSLRVVVSLMFALSMGSPAVADVTGTWRGVMVGTASDCPVPTPIGGPITLQLSQSGNQITGSLVFEHRTDDCRVIAPGQPPDVVSVPVSGTASGPTFALSFPVGPGLEATANGAVSGNLITFTFAAGDTTGQGIASKAGTAPAKFAGTWIGTADAAATFCSPPVRMSIPMTLAMTQSGSSLSGTATMRIDTDDCVKIVPRDLGSSFTATADGHSFSSSFAVDDDVQTVTFTAATVEVNVDDPADDEMVVAFYAGDTSGRVTLRRAAATTTPVVMSFAANPSIIERGRSAVLSWTTANATSVSIDNGVGVQAPSGSVTVTPLQTTTYTLIATGAGGVATGTTKVTVSPGSSRRRSARSASADRATARP